MTYPPDLLRRAIESVGIEKRSDYTLVLEEVERLMDERLVDKVAMAIANEIDEGTFYKAPGFQRASRAAIDASGLSALIRAATDLVKEAEEMGFGKTSEKALPGSWDAMVKALDEAKK